MSFTTVLIFTLYLISLFIYTDTVSKIFDDEEIDLYLFAFSGLAAFLAFIYFSMIGLYNINIISLILYSFMLLASYLSAKTNKRIEEDRDILDND